MAAVSGVNIAMLPEEHAEYWQYLTTTGDIWARALADGARACRYPPCPPAEFLQRHARAIENYGTVSIYLGFPKAILEPRFQAIATTVDGEQVEREYLDHAGSELLRYNYGVIDHDGIMNRTTTSYYTSYLQGNVFRKHPPEFVKWARKVTAWLRKRIAGEVPVYRCNYSIPASARTIEAVTQGLKVV